MKKKKCVTGANTKFTWQRVTQKKKLHNRRLNEKKQTNKQTKKADFNG